MLPVLEAGHSASGGAGLAVIGHARSVLVIGSEAKRSNALVDCFVASLLAMTIDGRDTALPAALELLDYFGIAVFAVSGALLAAEKRQTLVTFIFFAVVTGVGGGTLRDLLIGAPVFWVHTNATLLICIVAALWRVADVAAAMDAGQALLWFDAAGLAAYATYGAAKSLSYRRRAGSGLRHGRADRLRRRDHPRRAGRRAVDPDAARTLRDRRRAFRRAVRRAWLCSGSPA